MVQVDEGGARESAPQRGKCGLAHMESRGIHGWENSRGVEIRRNRPQLPVLCLPYFAALPPTLQWRLLQSRIMQLK